MEHVREFIKRPNRFNTLAVLGIENQMVWAARFKLNPFTSFGFHTADVSGSDNDVLNNVGKLLGGMTQWRVKDREMHVLVHRSLTLHLWSSYFCMYVGYSGGQRIISACGPFGDDGGANDFRMEPADPMIRLYDVEETIMQRLSRQENIEPEVKESIPVGDTWDWYEAISVCHLYNEHDYTIKKENNGRPIICF